MPHRNDPAGVVERTRAQAQNSVGWSLAVSDSATFWKSAKRLGLTGSLLLERAGRSGGRGRAVEELLAGEENPGPVGQSAKGPPAPGRLRAALGRSRAFQPSRLDETAARGSTVSRASAAVSGWSTV
jgi:hypothetical protein